MSVFDDYSAYYNLIYKDKDYKGESEFIYSLIKKHHPDASTILDLGCGTGIHDNLLSKMGFNIIGVDNSTQMLKDAEKHKIKGKLEFRQGDIRTLKLNQKFDVIISLFHVMSYQVKNDDITNAFKSIKNHLNPDGIFIFDFWYGPAVLTNKPEVRVKRYSNEIYDITRISEPDHNVSENKVNVKFNLIIKEKKSGKVEEINELHPMRYFFKPEIEYFLKDQGLKMLEFKEWMTEKEPGVDSWSVYCIGGH